MAATFSAEDMQKVQEAVGKQHITRGFEQLGPERVARALKYRRGHTWEICFLAAAYGEPGRLQSLLDPLGQPVAVYMQVAAILGMDPTAVHVIVGWYDSDFLRPLLLRLAEEWLEQNRRPMEQAATTAAVAG